jgi:cytoplasmic iron level regulating protein YaaA (DUF328/UPF0246 family)
MLLALLSPAKRLDFTPPPSFAKATRPGLLKDTALLAARGKALTRADLRRLMDISPKLADLNYDRFQSFDPQNRTGTKPAIFAFAGDVYGGFDAGSLSVDDIAFAQEHVAILSGLYGLLRPLDAIQPYRLEMGTRLATARGGTLYDFWRDALVKHLNARCAKLDRPTVVNLASEEYWSAVDADALHAPVIQPVFKEIKGGKARVVSFLAKKARGLMARDIVQRRLTAPESLKAFDAGGYAFDAKASDAARWVFSRKAG